MVLHFLILFSKKKDRLLDEERENVKNIEYMANELKTKLENEKNSLNEMINQKKDLNETVITLEKQNSDLVENLNAQINSTNQLKSQYTNLLRVRDGFAIFHFFRILI